MHSSNKKYQLTENVLFQKVMDETVILESETGIYFTLDPVATDIVELFQSGKNITEVSEQMTATYQVTKQQVDADITELLEQMTAKGLMIEQ